MACPKSNTVVRSVYLDFHVNRTEDAALQGEASAHVSGPRSLSLLQITLSAETEKSRRVVYRAEVRVSPRAACTRAVGPRA